MVPHVLDSVVGLRKYGQIRRVRSFNLDACKPQPSFRPALDRGTAGEMILLRFILPGQA